MSAIDTNNVIQFPTVTRADDRPRRGFWAELRGLRALPARLTRANKQLHDYYDTSSYPYPQESFDEIEPATLPQQTPLYATVEYPDREVWHQVVGWYWHTALTAYVPLLVLVDECVTGDPSAFPYFARLPLHFHVAPSANRRLALVP